jgi:PAS domain-containing protein
VRLRGVCGAIFNPRLQIIGIVIHLPSLSELQVIGTAPADPFSMAARPIDSLQRFMQGASGHQIHVRGVVTAYFPNQEFFISDRTGGLFVRAREGMPLKPGDQVNVVGFPSIVDDRAALVDATFHRRAGGTPPAPLPLTAVQALDGKHDSALVEIEGELGAISPVGNDKVLVLHQAGTTFTARVRAADPAVTSLREGSRVRLTGICLVQYDLLGNPLALNLRLRSGRDIVVTRRASWLTMGHALWILGVLGLVIILALAWIASLRRRVQKQTKIIRTTLESAGDGILVADSRRIIMTYNQQFVEMWRIPEAVLNTRGKHSLLQFTLSQVKDPDAYLAKVDSLYENREAQADDVIEFLDGRVFEYHSEPLWIGGTPRGRIWGFRDVTHASALNSKPRPHPTHANEADMGGEVF